jgi:hypothetical protein
MPLQSGSDGPARVSNVEIVAVIFDSLGGVEAMQNL